MRHSILQITFPLSATNQIGLMKTFPGFDLSNRSGSSADQFSLNLRENRQTILVLPKTVNTKQKARNVFFILLNFRIRVYTGYGS